MDYSHCGDLFKKNNLWSNDQRVFNKNYVKWSLKNHPDKNPNNIELFKEITGCKTECIEHFDDCKSTINGGQLYTCLLYTSDAADE